MGKMERECSRGEGANITRLGGKRRGSCLKIVQEGRASRGKSASGTNFETEETGKAAGEKEGSSDRIENH